MVYVSFVILPKAVKGLEGVLNAEEAIVDHYVGKAGKTSYLIATTDSEVEYTGLNPATLSLSERENENIMAFIAGRDINFSRLLFRLYADPLANPYLALDERINDGFIFKAEKAYHIPEDNLKIVKEISQGERINAVYRKEGAISAKTSEKTLCIRFGDFHLAKDSILSFFNEKSQKAITLNPVSFSIKNKKITVDNTFKPKAVKLAMKKMK
jgi:fructose 1,6-bisphosphatase